MQKIKDIIKSIVAPKETNVMWIDTSNGGSVLKTYNNGSWKTLSGASGGSSSGSSINNLLDIPINPLGALKPYVYMEALQCAVPYSKGTLDTLWESVENVKVGDTMYLFASSSLLKVDSNSDVDSPIISPKLAANSGIIESIDVNNSTFTLIAKGNTTSISKSYTKNSEDYKIIFIGELSIRSGSVEVYPTFRKRQVSSDEISSGVVTVKTDDVVYMQLSDLPTLSQIALNGNGQIIVIKGATTDKDINFYPYVNFPTGTYKSRSGNKTLVTIPANKTVIIENDNIKAITNYTVRMTIYDNK